MPFHFPDPSSETTEYYVGYYGDLGENTAVALCRAPVPSPQ